MPRFPFRRSPGQDLRDLFAHDRLQTQARDLGYSSISYGEGALDILNGSGGAVARFGWVGEAGGFLLRRGSDWVTVQDYFAFEFATLEGRLTDRLEHVEGVVNGHGARLGAAEGRLDGHAGRLGASENDITSLKGRADAHAQRIGALEGRADAHAQRIGATEGDVQTLQSRADAHAQRIGATEGDVQNLKDRADAHVQRIGALENKDASISSSLNKTIDMLKDLDAFVASMHPDKPYFPPPVKT